MPNERNKKTLDNLKEKFEKSNSVVFADYTGLDVNQINDLRAKIKEAGGGTTVAKNTLVNIALDETGYDNNTDGLELSGPLATFFSFGDALAPLKVLADFIKEFKIPVIKFGFLDKDFISADKIKVLSELPSRQELLGRFVGSIKSPISGIVNVLKGSQRKFIYALSAIAESKSNNEEEVSK